MKIIIVDGSPYFYRPENEEEEKQMAMSLARAVRGHKLKIPERFKITDKLTQLTGKNLKEVLAVIRSDSGLQSLCSAMYASEHPTYNPSEVNEVNAEVELRPEALAGIREQIKQYKVKPLKRTNT